MLLIENLCNRLREWQEEVDEPDLVPRFRRLWTEKVPVAAPIRTVAVRHRILGLDIERAQPVRRAS